MAEENEITAIDIAENAIAPSKKKELRNVLVLALALAIETYKDLCLDKANEPEPKLLITELDELLNYGFERVQNEGEADMEQKPEYVKNIDGVRWGCEVVSVTGANKVCITKDKRAVRYCNTMEAFTEKLIEFNLLK